MPTREELQAYARRRASELGVNPDEIVALGNRESAGFTPDIHDSAAGAIGPMQLMPETARGLGVDPRDPYQNIDGGIRYYLQQRQRFGSPELAAAAYNAGPEAVARHGGVPPFRETQNYVARFRQDLGGAQPQGQSSDDIFGFSQGHGQAPAAPPAQGGGQNSDDIFGFQQGGHQAAPGGSPAPAAPHPAPAGPQLVTEPPAPQGGHQPPRGMTAAQERALATIQGNLSAFQMIGQVQGAANRARGPHAVNAGVGAGGNNSAALAEARYGATAPSVLQDERTVGGRGILEQMTSNLGVGDELHGGAAYLQQAGRNLYDQATGHPIEVSGADAYHAGAERDRTGQASFAREHPVANVGAGALGFLTAGAPNAIRAIPAGLSTAARITKAALNAGASNLPFAFAAAQGNPIERIPATLAGGALGVLTGGALHGAGEGIAGLAARTRAAPLTAARELVNRDIPITSGMIRGGGARQAEDVSTSAALAGNAIRQRQYEAVVGLNRQTWNETLAPVGASLPHDVQAGRSALRYASDTIGAARKAAVSGVGLQVDAPLASGLNTAIARQADQRVAHDLDTIVAQTILPRLQGGHVSGETWASVDEELGSLIRRSDGHDSSPGGGIGHYYTQGLKELQQSWRDMFARQSPDQAEATIHANESWARLVRLRDAMNSPATSRRDGILTPAQINSAVARNASGNSFAYGRALGQDLSEPAMAVMPSTIPETGTGPRLAALMQPALMTGMAGAGAGAMTGHPVLGAVAGGLPLVGAGLKALSYSRRAQAIYRGLYRAGSPANRAAAADKVAVLAGLLSRNPGAPLALRSIAEARRHAN